ncbi:MAG TPA: glycosyltransferase [Thermoanaerobaculia bacterium]
MRLPHADPERLRVLHVGGYWRGENDMVRHMMLGLAAAGAGVLEYSTDAHPEALETDGRAYDRGTFGPVWLKDDALMPLVEDFRPDLIVCNAGGLSFRPEVSRRLRERVCLLGIALSDPDVFEPSTSRIAANFDAFLTNAPELLPKYRARGARPAVLPIATNEEFFRPAPPRPEMSCDVLVLGRAHPDRVEPVRALVAAFDTHVYGEGWDAHGIKSRGTIAGEDVLAALCSAKVTVVFFRTGAGHALVKVGLFDFAAAGALVATNRFAEVERYFAFDEEILGFDDTPDLLRRIRRVLDHPLEAEAIRRAGRERVLREHTWRRVWPAILRDLAEAPS